MGELNRGDDGRLVIDWTYVLAVATSVDRSSSGGAIGVFVASIAAAGRCVGKAPARV